MILPLDKTRRDSELFQYSPKSLRAYIAPNHILLKIDELFDFSYVVELVQPFYCADNGRAAIHPEILLRALLIGCIHNITSFRQLCLRIQENLTYRWFLFMRLEDEVFDHSTISYFISRMGEDTFRAILKQFSARGARLPIFSGQGSALGGNQRLYELGLVSDQVYCDSTLLKAHVDETHLSSTGLTPEEFVKQVIQENNVYLEPLETKTSGVVQSSPPVVQSSPPVAQSSPPEESSSVVETKRYQDSKGKLPLSSVDPDARWQAKNKKERARVFAIKIISWWMMKVLFWRKRQPIPPVLIPKPQKS